MFTCALNGVQFLSIDERLYIEDIEEQPSIEAETATRPAYGQTLVGMTGRHELSISITFMVKQCNRATRQGVISAVNGWAKDGWLTLNTRPGQRLYVFCSEPATSVAYAWHESMRITFTAYDDAIWQEIEPKSTNITGASGTASITPNGTSPCCLEADIRNTSGGVVTSCALSANGKTITLSGMSLASGKTLRLYYDKHNNLIASVDGAGILAYRTPESADDVWLTNGQANTVTFAASGACAVTLYARGRYD